MKILICNIIGAKLSIKGRSLAAMKALPFHIHIITILLYIHSLHTCIYVLEVCDNARNYISILTIKLSKIS